MFAVDGHDRSKESVPAGSDSLSTTYMKGVWMIHKKMFFSLLILLFLTLCGCSAKDKALTDYYRNVVSFSQGVIYPEMDTRRPFLGNPGAPVAVVEYSNFQCSFCAEYAPRKKRYIESHPDRAVFFFKHFARAELSFLQALYFEALARQSHEAAWQYYALAFKHQEKIHQQGQSALEEIVSSLPIDMEIFLYDLLDQDVKETVLNDVKEAEDFGFPGTPVFVINGYPVIGAVPWHVIEDIIEMVEAKQPVEFIHENDTCEEE